MAKPVLQAGAVGRARLVLCKAPGTGSDPAAWMGARMSVLLLSQRCVGNRPRRVS